MKIKFLKPHKVQQGDGQGPRYSVGEEVSFDGPVAETYARKYIERGLAEEVMAEAPKPVEAAPAQDRSRRYGRQIPEQQSEPEKEQETAPAEDQKPE